MSVASFVVQLVLGIAVSAYVVRRDLRRLSGEQLARAWNDASFWSAVVVFGPLCIPFHFVKTRRSLRGVLLGIGWMLVALVVLSAVAALLERLGLMTDG